MFMNKIGKFFHRLLNPHCAECKFEEDELLSRKIEEEQCNACLVLKEMLDKAIEEKKELLEHVIRLSTPAVPVVETDNQREIKPIRRGPIMFSAQRAELERINRNAEKDRAKEIIKDLNDKDRISLPNVEVMEQVIKNG